LISADENDGKLKMYNIHVEKVKCCS